MLKIRDDFDLEKLKDYGFEYDDYIIKTYVRKIGGRWYNLTCIDVDDREIYEMTEKIGYWTVTSSDEEFFDENAIKDLIDLGIVEKVSDEDE